MYSSTTFDDCRTEEEKINEFLVELGKINKSGFWKVKRLIDLTISIIALIVLAIPMLIIWCIIYFSDTSVSPIYSQIRVGRHGEPFRMYKFRTMVADADKRLDDVRDLNEMDGPVFKIKDDPRITGFGKLLRKTSLDELPQLFNVIKGDMTLIGPRPPLPSEADQYTEYQKLRCIVTPGITCIWQIQPKRNEIPFEKWVEMDLDYVLHRTVWLDIKIIIMTVIVMLRGEGR